MKSLYYQVTKLYDAGMTAEMIGQALGMTTELVGDMIQDYLDWRWNSIYNQFAVDKVSQIH